MNTNLLSQDHLDDISNDYRLDWHSILQFSNIVDMYRKRGVITIDEFDKLLLFAMEKGNSVIIAYLHEFNMRDIGNSGIVTETVNGFMANETSFEADIIRLKNHGFILNDVDPTKVSKVFISADKKALLTFLFICVRNADGKYLVSPRDDVQKLRQRFVRFLGMVTGNDPKDVFFRERFRNKFRYACRLVKEGKTLDYFL